jgi:Flp pilus assembly protein TadD
MLGRLVTFLAFGMAVPTHAEWKEAVTDHFIVYADKPDAELQKFSERLEAVHYLMARANGLQSEKAPVRVKIYVYGDAAKLAKLVRVPNAAGFYRPNPEGAMAVTPARTAGLNLNPIEVLQHEYAHHFMLQYFPAAYPAWYVEGYAELMNTASFERKGAITFGKANSSRANELNQSVWVDAGDIVSKLRKDLPSGSKDNFYGQSWLLAHYLTLSPERSQQLRAYLNAINRGASQADAAKAFGDLGKFNTDVKRYLTNASFEYKALPLPETLAANIAMRKLSASEIELMEDAIELSRQKSKEDAESFAAQLRGKVSKFGPDRYASQLLGEAELAAGNFDAAIAIADRILALQAGDSKALWLKAAATLEKAKGSDDPEDAALKARDWALEANKNDPDAPRPLVAFFDSYLVAREQPSIDALESMREAVRRVPQDKSLRFKLAATLAMTGNRDHKIEAIRALRPVAFDPHGGAAAEGAGKMIESLMGAILKGSEPVMDLPPAIEPEE